MTHPGFTSRRLADMRAVLDEEPLTPINRDVVAGAIASVEARWADDQRTSYANGVAMRDELYRSLVDGNTRLRVVGASITAQVRTGRVDAARGRSILRDAMAEHAHLVASLVGLATADTDLAGKEAASADEYQDQQFDRQPMLLAHAPTLNNAIADYQAAHADELNTRLEAARRASRPRYPVAGPMGISPDDLRAGGRIDVGN